MEQPAAPVRHEQQARRIKAAQALGGHSSVEKLAEELQRRESRIGLKRLRSLWRGTERAQRPDLVEIAGACELPYEFFTVDFTRLGELEPAGLSDRVAALEAEMRTLTQELQTLAVEARPRNGASGSSSQGHRTPGRQP